MIILILFILLLKLNIIIATYEANNEKECPFKLFQNHSNQSISDFNFIIT